jgi:hypothetical protein
MRIMENILAKVVDDRKANYHTNSAHPTDIEGKDTLLTQLQAVFPDCRVYLETMVTGIYDKKTFIKERVRADLKKFVENPRLCVVVDWSSL